MNVNVRKLFHCIMAIGLCLTHIPSAEAAEVFVPGLPRPGQMVSLSVPFTPALIKGMTIDPKNGLKFDFLMEKGQQDLSPQERKAEYDKLIRYFLTSLTVSDKDQWVNLSPYESGRIIENNFGTTQMGRDLLAQDYLLKQITSSLMYPESGLGKTFWDKVYKKVQSEYPNKQIPVNVVNKVWITPDEAVVYESKGSAVILKSHLKVMLEEDYLACRQAGLAVAKNQTTTRGHVSSETCPQAGCQGNNGLNVKATQGNNGTRGISSQIIKEIILPELEREVNEGKNFAQLRQIVSAMVLATWYKQSLKNTILGQVYADKAKVKGVELNKALGDPQEIYKQYLSAFKKGVFNYIKEEPVSLRATEGSAAISNQMIPRKYFAGGFDNAMSATLKIIKSEGNKGNSGFPSNNPNVLRQLMAVDYDPISSIYGNPNARPVGSFVSMVGRLGSKKDTVVVELRPKTNAAMSAVLDNKDNPIFQVSGTEAILDLKTKAANSGFGNLDEGSRGVNQKVVPKESVKAWANALREAFAQNGEQYTFNMGLVDVETNKVYYGNPYSLLRDLYGPNVTNLNGLAQMLQAIENNKLIPLKIGVGKRGPIVQAIPEGLLEEKFKELLPNEEMRQRSLGLKAKLDKNKAYRQQAIKAMNDVYIDENIAQLRQDLQREKEIKGVNLAHNLSKVRFAFKMNIEQAAEGIYDSIKVNDGFWSMEDFEGVLMYSRTGFVYLFRLSEIALSQIAPPSLVEGDIKIPISIKGGVVSLKKLSTAPDGVTDHRKIYDMWYKKTFAGIINKINEKLEPARLAQAKGKTQMAKMSGVRVAYEKFKFAMKKTFDIKPKYDYRLSDADFEFSPDFAPKEEAKEKLSKPTEKHEIKNPLKPIKQSGILKSLAEDVVWGIASLSGVSLIRHVMKKFRDEQVEEDFLDDRETENTKTKSPLLQKPASANNPIIVRRANELRQTYTGLGMPQEPIKGFMDKKSKRLYFGKTGEMKGLEEGQLIEVSLEKKSYYLRLNRTSPEANAELDKFILSINQVLVYDAMKEHRPELLADPLGGIDLNADNMNLLIKKDGNGVMLPIEQQDLNMLNRIEGFVPNIIEIKPTMNVPIFTELKQKIHSIAADSTS